MNEQELEGVALKTLLSASETLFLDMDRAVEAIKGSARNRSMSNIGFLRESSFVSECDIETIGNGLIETFEFTNKTSALIESVCDARGWSVRTAVAELKIRALRALRARAEELESELRKLDGVGHKSIDEIGSEARQIADLIMNRKEGWPIGVLGV